MNDIGSINWEKVHSFEGEHENTGNSALNAVTVSHAKLLFQSTCSCSSQTVFILKRNLTSFMLKKEDV
jgi:hypothetical protein